MNVPRENCCSITIQSHTYMHHTHTHKHVLNQLLSFWSVMFISYNYHYGYLSIHHSVIHIFTHLTKIYWVYTVCQALEVLSAAFNSHTEIWRKILVFWTYLHIRTSKGCAIDVRIKLKQRGPCWELQFSLNDANLWNSAKVISVCLCP